MLILTIKTDQPTAEIGVYKDAHQLGYESWEAHRQLSVTLLSKIEGLLKTTGKDWENIQGIIFFKGPGSFTGLRIGASLVNALAFENKPVVGVNGKKWIEDGIALLQSGANDASAIPEYGTEPRTTKPKK